MNAVSHFVMTSLKIFSWTYYPISIFSLGYLTYLLVNKKNPNVWIIVPTFLLVWIPTILFLMLYITGDPSDKLLIVLFSPAIVITLISSGLLAIKLKRKEKR